MSSLIYKPLEFTAGPNGRAEVITTPFIRGMWSDTTSELMTFYTSSLQTTASQEYYYEVWSSASLNCENNEKVFFLGINFIYNCQSIIPIRRGHVPFWYGQSHRRVLS